MAGSECAYRQTAADEQCRQTERDPDAGAPFPRPEYRRRADSCTSFVNVVKLRRPVMKWRWNHGHAIMSALVLLVAGSWAQDMAWGQKGSDAVKRIHPRSTVPKKT